ncbi:hypothetical protein F7725_021591 [Dissostichus mawsoni]|uniref:Uncharacterized protein n=1 Tax=Dissostichus mawsoni TaxID=36200 RepID=A0A7J5ZBM5_DISMA|nr:hypothetical protein F7725_021591 [Dissostichus mawsoni]
MTTPWYGLEKEKQQHTGEKTHRVVQQQEVVGLRSPQLLPLAQGQEILAPLGAEEEVQLFTRSSKLRQRRCSEWLSCLRQDSDRLRNRRGREGFQFGNRGSYGGLCLDRRRRCYGYRWSSNGLMNEGQIAMDSFMAGGEDSIERLGGASGVITSTSAGAGHGARIWVAMGVAGGKMTGSTTQQQQVQEEEEVEEVEVQPQSLWQMELGEVQQVLQGKGEEAMG